jgi:hypothetical protein
MANTKNEKKTVSKTAEKKSTTKVSKVEKVEEVAPVVEQVAAVKPAKAASKAAPKSKAAAKEVAPAPAAVEEVAAAPAPAPAPAAKAASKVAAKAPKAASKAGSKKSADVKAPKNLKVAKKVPKAQKGGDDDEEDEEPGKRYFKCITIDSNGLAHATGRYSGKKPKQAASKACTRLYEELKAAGDDIPEKIVFGMHESTRASKKKKKYFYVGCRVKLDTPEEVPIKKIDPKTGKPMVIRYNYNNDVRKLTDLECEEYPLLSNYDAKDDEEVDVSAKKVKVVKKAKKAASSKAVPKKVKAVAKKAASAPAKKAAAPAKKVAAKKDAVKVKKAEKVAPAKAATKAAK